MGGVQEIVIEVSVDVALYGRPGFPGRLAAITASTFEVLLSPTTFLAVILN